MDRHPHAYHCLPLVVANQWGWQVTCPADVRVTWDGSPAPAGLKVEVDPQYAVAIKSQFGEGIVTFSPPWLFRTPAGWDLLARGPANRWKPNCVPLEGIIETWWLPYTFTFNWKLIEPGEITLRPGRGHRPDLPGAAPDVRRGDGRRGTAGRRAGLAAEMSAWRDERRKRADQRQRNH